MVIIKKQNKSHLQSKLYFLRRSINYSAPLERVKIKKEIKELEKKIDKINRAKIKTYVSGHLFIKKTP
jgi:hypothetical protein